MDQFGHPHQKDDMMHNYAHDPSTSNHLGLSTITHQKVKSFVFAK
jgi:hypothetical protein